MKTNVTDNIAGKRTLTIALTHTGSKVVKESDKMRFNKLTKKLSYLFMSLAMLITAGLTTASCSKDDDQSVPQNSALAEALEGEWIIEQAIDNIEGYDLDDEMKESLSDGGTQAILYHFYDDGTCWKEIDLMKDGQLVDQLISRYATNASTYTVDASGKVVITIKNIEAESDESEVLTFDGTRLTTKYAGADLACTLIRATNAQIQLYKDESDAWYGGNAGDAEGHPLSESVLGEIVGTDGLAYDAVYKGNLPEGVSAAGMVAYKNGTKGLVIALSEEANQMNWSTANGQSGAAAHTPTISGQTWKLPSSNDWKNMINAFASSNLYYIGLNQAIKSAGGTPFRMLSFYWTSSVLTTGRYSTKLNFNRNNAYFGYGNVNNAYIVRACLAF